MAWQHHRPRKCRLDFKRETVPVVVLVGIGGAGEWELRNGLLPGAPFIRDAEDNAYMDARAVRKRDGRWQGWTATIDGVEWVGGSTLNRAVLRAIFTAGLAKPATSQIANQYLFTKGEQP